MSEVATGNPTATAATAAALCPNKSERIVKGSSGIHKGKKFLILPHYNEAYQLTSQQQARGVYNQLLLSKAIGGFLFNQLVDGLGKTGLPKMKKPGEILPRVFSPIPLSDLSFSELNGS